MTRKQKLFQCFPLDGSVTVAGEELTTPYHIYDGTILSLGGTVDAEAAARLLAAEHLEPVLDTDGRALAAIWVCDFTEANLGAHHELQISLFATQRRVPPLKSGAFSYYRALATHPNLMMVCHGLWNDTQRVVRYNAEHLLLDAKLTLSDVDFLPIAGLSGSATLRASRSLKVWCHPRTGNRPGLHGSSPDKSDFGAYLVF